MFSRYRRSKLKCCSNGWYTFFPKKPGKMFSSRHSPNNLKSWVPHIEVCPNGAYIKNVILHLCPLASNTICTCASNLMYLCPLASKVIALVPLGFQDHCICAPWLSRSLHLCSLVSKVTALVPLGFQDHCTCAPRLPRSLHLCPLDFKITAHVHLGFQVYYICPNRDQCTVLSRTALISQIRYGGEFTP